jgi:hypothetical protein
LVPARKGGLKVRRLQRSSQAVNRVALPSRYPPDAVRGRLGRAHALAVRHHSGDPEKSHSDVPLHDRGVRRNGHPGRGLCDLRTAALSAFALKALEGRAGCLLANHGMIAIGATLDRAMWLAVELEDHCQAVLPFTADRRSGGFRWGGRDHFWTRFGAALLFSMIQDANVVGRAYVTNQVTGGNAGAVYYGANTQSAMENVAGTTLRSSINAPPVLKKNQGERVTIFVRNDLDFSGVYRRKASAHERSLRMPSQDRCTVCRIGYVEHDVADSPTDRLCSYLFHHGDRLQGGPISHAPASTPRRPSPDAYPSRIGESQK